MASRDRLDVVQDRIDRYGSVPDLDDRSVRESIAGIGFAIPYLVVFGTFLLFPLLLGLYMSFHDWHPIDPALSEFVGLANYETMFEDPRFWTAMKNTVYFVVLTVPALVIGGLLLALGVNRDIKGKILLRTIFFSPYVITVSVVGLVGIDMFSGVGLVPYWLSYITGERTNWLTSHTLAMPAVAIITIWWTIAFNFVILLAARQNVPDRLYEAAKLDGASSWRMMTDITIPQMKNPLIFVVIVSFIASFQVFGQPFIMTDGGPGYATTTIVVYLYQSAFSGREFGYAAAIGYVLFMILVAVSGVSFKLLGGGDE